MKYTVTCTVALYTGQLTIAVSDSIKVETFLQGFPLHLGQLPWNSVLQSQIKSSHDCDGVMTA